MRKFLICAVGLAAMMTGAMAADMPYKSKAYIAADAVAPVSWTGFYVGINGGGGWSTQDQTIAGTDAFTNAVVASGFVPGTVATRGAGGMFGGTIGYNFQITPSFVLGVEGDFDWADIGGSGGQSLAIGPFALNTAGSEKLNWLSTFRGRAGWLAMPGTMFYVTGGVAFGEAESMSSITLVTPGTTFVAAADTSAFKTGWVVGAGLEQQLYNRWSIKGEYDYVSLGSIGNTFGTTIGPFNPTFASNQDLRFHTVKVGLNYRF